MEDLALSEWPGQPVDLNGSNPWLPAYGFQQPMTLLDKEDFLGHPGERMPGSRRFATIHQGHGIQRKFWIFFFLLKVVLSSCQAKYAIDNLHNFELFSGSAATIFIPLLGMSKLISRLVYNDKINKMFETLDNDFWDLSIIDKALDEKISKECSIISHMYSNHIYISILLATLLGFFPLAVFPDGRKQLPTVLWLPFDIDWTPMYEFMFFVILMGQILIVVSHANYDHLYVYFSQNVSVQFCILKECLKNITKVPSISDGEKKNSREYQSIIKARLKHCVTHHIKLSNFLSDFQDIYSFSLGIQVVLSILTLVFIGYILETEDNDIPKTIKLLVYVGVLSIQACLYAVYGSIIEHHYETVAEAIYDSEWYFGDKGFQHGIQFVLRIAQIPVKVTAMGLTEINNTSIIMIYKTVFSILTLIKQLVNNED